MKCQKNEEDKPFSDDKRMDKNGIILLEEAKWLVNTLGRESLLKPIMKGSRNRKELLPLHILLIQMIATTTTSGNQANYNELVKWIIEVCPECAQVPTNQKTSYYNYWTASRSSHQSSGEDTPLHLACRILSVDVSLLKVIYEAYPQAIQTRNAKGETPFHILCQQQCDTSPGAMTMKTNDNNESSLQQVQWLQQQKKCNDYEESLLFLLQTYPDALHRMTYQCGETPFHIVVQRLSRRQTRLFPINVWNHMVEMASDALWICDTHLYQPPAMIFVKYIFNNSACSRGGELSFARKILRAYPT